MTAVAERRADSPAAARLRLYERDDGAVDIELSTGTQRAAASFTAGGSSPRTRLALGHLVRAMGLDQAEALDARGQGDPRANGTDRTISAWHPAKRLRTETERLDWLLARLRPAELARLGIGCVGLPSRSALDDAIAAEEVDRKSGRAAARRGS